MLMRISTLICCRSGGTFVRDSREKSEQRFHGAPRAHAIEMKSHGRNRADAAAASASEQSAALFSRST